MISKEEKELIKEAINLIENNELNSNNKYIAKMKETLKFIKTQKPNSDIKEFIKYYKDCLQTSLDTEK